MCGALSLFKGDERSGGGIVFVNPACRLFLLRTSAIQASLIALGLSSVFVFVFVLVNYSISHEAVIMLDEVGNALYGALLVNRERGVIYANKRVPVGARLTLYLV